MGFQVAGAWRQLEYVQSTGVGFEIYLAKRHRKDKFWRFFEPWRNQKTSPYRMHGWLMKITIIL
jgi:hypothetical protein